MPTDAAAVVVRDPLPGAARTRPAVAAARKGVLATIGLLLAFGAVARDDACAVAAATTPATSAARVEAAAPASFADARVVVDADDLRVCAQGREVLSLRAQSAQALRREHPGEWPFLSVEYSVKPLSLVGPYLSIEERRVAENPSAYLRTRVRTYDLRTPGREVALPALFADPALKQALLADPLLREAAGPVLAKAAGRGADSTALAARLSGMHAAPDAQGRPTTPPGWLGGFWIAGRDGARLKVGLALPRLDGMREEALSRTTLLLPAPAALAAVLDGLAPQAGAGLAAAAWTVAPAAVDEDGARWARWRFDQRP